ncbi:lipopolysaccharide biosynthesis protein [Vagococcus fluvialis]|uniref:lipopolysaccharide biosynthesis protein n=1 Tax=Vagococcus fluvialis TaxID=2738 RepID=UPI0037ADDF89
MEGKYNKLLNNSLIFAIGNLGSKLITFLLVPLYTYVLSTTEFGIVDLSTTITTMLLPVVSLCIYEAVLRFSIKEKEPIKILNNSLALIVISNMLMLIIAITLLIILKNYLIIYLCLILIFQNFQSVLSQYARAVGKVKLFAANGIVMTLGLLISNIFLLVVLKLGIKGYLISIIISNIVSIIFLTINLNILNKINIKVIDKNLLKSMLKYSLPLIPNTLMWWVINASSRIFIVYYLDASQNGLFAVSSKIPTILNIFYAIFFQAWQLSAIEEYKSENSSEYYSLVFRYLSFVLLILSSILIVFIQPLMSVLVASNFYESWKYIPILLLANIFSSFSSFVGTTYTVSMNTKGVFYSSLTGAIISIILNFILIPSLGIIGAAISQVISFLFIWIFRHIQTNNMVKIEIKFQTIISIIIVVFQTIVATIITSTSLFYIFQIILLTLIIIVNFNNIRNIKGLILKFV